MKTRPNQKVVSFIEELYEDEDKLKEEMNFDEYKVIVLSDTVSDLTDDEFQQFMYGVTLTKIIKEQIIGEKDEV